MTHRRSEDDENDRMEDDEEISSEPDEEISSKDDEGIRTEADESNRTKAVQEISTDEALRILADGKRRYVLLELLERDPTEAIQIESPETIDGLFGEEGNSGGGDKRLPHPATDENTDRLVIELRHNHLPRLADADVIVWDEEQAMVKRGPEFSEVRPFLRRLDEYSEELPTDWSR